MLKVTKKSGPLFDPIIIKNGPPLGWGLCSLLLSWCALSLPTSFNFLPVGPFFPCSFLIFSCSLLRFNFSSCSWIFCFMLLFSLLHAPFLHFLCSLLQDYHLSAPCSRGGFFPDFCIRVWDFEILKFGENWPENAPKRMVQCNWEHFLIWHWWNMHFLGVKP